MFDIGFSKLLLIALVALVVLGPDRLPKLARTAGHLFGRLQRYVATVKADINREMQTSDLQKVKEDFQAAAKDIEQSVQASQTEIQSSMRSLEASLAPVDGTTSAAITTPSTAFTTAPAAVLPPPILTGEAALLEMHATSLSADYLSSTADAVPAPSLREAGLQRFDLGLEPLRKQRQTVAVSISNSDAITPSNKLFGASEPQLAPS